MPNVGTSPWVAEFYTQPPPQATKKKTLQPPKPNHFSKFSWTCVSLRNCCNWHLFGEECSDLGGAPHQPAPVATKKPAMLGGRCGWFACWVFLKLIPRKFVFLLWFEGCLQPACLLRTPDWCAHIPEAQKHYSPDSLRDGFGRCKRGGWVNSPACGCHILFTESLGIFFGDDSRKPVVFKQIGWRGCFERCDWSSKKVAVFATVNYFRFDVVYRTVQIVFSEQDHPPPLLSLLYITWTGGRFKWHLRIAMSTSNHFGCGLEETSMAKLWGQGLTASSCCLAAEATTWSKLGMETVISSDGNSSPEGAEKWGILGRNNPPQHRRVEATNKGVGDVAEYAAEPCMKRWFR